MPVAPRGQVAHPPWRFLWVPSLPNPAVPEQEQAEPDGRFIWREYSQGLPL